MIPLITSLGDGVNYVPIFICDSQTVFCSWIWRDVLLEVKWFCSTFVQNYNCNSEIKTNDDDWIFRLRSTNTPSDSESRIVSNLKIKLWLHLAWIFISVITLYRLFQFRRFSLSMLPQFQVISLTRSFRLVSKAHRLGQSRFRIG